MCCRSAQKGNLSEAGRYPLGSTKHILISTFIFREQKEGSTFACPVDTPIPDPGTYVSPVHENQPHNPRLQISTWWSWSVESPLPLLLKKCLIRELQWATLHGPKTSNKVKRSNNTVTHYLGRFLRKREVAPFWWQELYVVTQWHLWLYLKLRSFFALLFFSKGYLLQLLPMAWSQDPVEETLQSCTLCCCHQARPSPIFK